MVEQTVVNHLAYLTRVSQEIVSQLHEKEKDYGGSWKKRGGCGAYMMLARKWDRIELAAQRGKYDIFEIASNDKRNEGIIDDIKDLTGYLLLVLAELRGREALEYLEKPVNPEASLDLNMFAESVGYKAHTKPSGMEHPFGYVEESK